MLADISANPQTIHVGVTLPEPLMKIELVVAIIAGVVAIISAFVAYIAQTNAAKAQADIAIIQLAAQQAHERQKPFVEAQMKFYVEATETVAQIPRARNTGAREALIKRFWQLYWGSLALVEDDEVAGAMVAYGEQLKENSPDPNTLEGLSLRVAHACRNSLKRLWVPELGTIQNIRPESK
jgi:Tfp pilus assembly protein PilE